MLVLAIAGAPASGAASSAAAEFALAHDLREQAEAEQRKVAAAVAQATAWQTHRAQARLRLARRQAEAQQVLALRRRELAAGLVALAVPARRDARAALILSGLAQAVALASARLDELGGEVAVLARQQRAAAAARTHWSARQAAAAAAGRATGVRWRAALRARIADLAHEGADGPGPPGDASVANPVTLAATPALLRPAAPKDHKRAIATDQRLDRRLLQLVAAAPSRRPPPRRLDPPQLAPGPLWPISGQLAAAGRNGLAITTDIAQVVSSPVAGTVMFAETFRGLGPLLIIDRGRGYHLVMSGMARLDVRRGASVVAGQSLGEVVARTDGPARLQLELRHRGLPIDPAPWLAAYHDKVRS